MVNRLGFLVLYHVMPRCKILNQAIAAVAERSLNVFQQLT